ncbi:hypothetical protein Gotri_001540 [Gossypium trilobum]|uniref:APS kinase domain-containing protein n=1 Tax=Gossypium trilobum TaxID=34281 RepID=A0A7J9FF12_9ROSI|nr:hypothetical protein [Gossypium trilobum]
MSTVGNSTNIFWQESPVGKLERQKLLHQKSCVVWITGLSGSGKSTLACSLSRELFTRGNLSYVLDGDNLRHGLNQDLGFKAEDRTENIRRVGTNHGHNGLEELGYRFGRAGGEVAKLFADAGLICIASLISPYRKDRDSCRAMLPDANFIEAKPFSFVFMNMPLTLCEERDPKGLYKLARAGKIKGLIDCLRTFVDRKIASLFPFSPPTNNNMHTYMSNGLSFKDSNKGIVLCIIGFTGIDDPYEPPLNCEIEIKQKAGVCPTPGAMAGEVVTYLEEKGYLQHQ